MSACLKMHEKVIFLGNEATKDKETKEKTVQ